MWINVKTLVQNGTKFFKMAVIRGFHWNIRIVFLISEHAILFRNRFENFIASPIECSKDCFRLEVVLLCYSFLGAVSHLVYHPLTLVLRISWSLYISSPPRLGFTGPESRKWNSEYETDLPISTGYICASVIEETSQVMHEWFLVMDVENIGRSSKICDIWWSLSNDWCQCLSYHIF